MDSDLLGLQDTLRGSQSPLFDQRRRIQHRIHRVLPAVRLTLTKQIASKSATVLITREHSPVSPRCADFGFAVTGWGDVTGDGVPELAVGSPMRDNAVWEDIGEVLIFNGADWGFLGRIRHPEPDFRYARFGYSLADGGDLNGDGVHDLIIGAPTQYDDRDSGLDGAVYLWSGRNTLLKAIPHPLRHFEAEFGIAVAGIPDVNGDNLPDVLIGARGEIIARVPGEAYVYSAGGVLLRMFLDPTPRSAIHLGHSVASVGDVNGDGVPDALIGTFASNFDLMNHPGEALLFSGADGSWIRTLVEPELQYESRFGSAVCSIGDADGDGLEELIVGAPYQDVAPFPDQGRAYLNPPTARFVGIEVLSTVYPHRDQTFKLAIITTPSFNALEVDGLTARLGQNLAAPLDGGRALDADRDGDQDLVLRFRTLETGIECGNPIVHLTGRQYDGTIVRGEDPITTAECP